jgi:hypothetical protein
MHVTWHETPLAFVASDVAPTFLAMAISLPRDPLILSEPFSSHQLACRIKALLLQPPPRTVNYLELRVLGTEPEPPVLHQPHVALDVRVRLCVRESKPTGEDRGERNKVWRVRPVPVLLLVAHAHTHIPVPKGFRQSSICEKSSALHS